MFFSDILFSDLHLSNSSQQSFGHFKYIRWWFGRLDGELDVSDMVWTPSRDPKKSYKYDLANSLVPLIALSLDHQNHSKWPKWYHVRYIVLVAEGLDAGASNVADAAPVVGLSNLYKGGAP